MKTKILTISILILIGMVVPLVLAATDTRDVEDVFKLNEIINYAKPCFNNGTYCSAVAVCNFTVFNPDNTVLVDNIVAINSDAYHNTTFSVINLGVHKVDMICNDGGLNGAETFYFEVTGSGFNDTIWFLVFILIFSVGVMILGFKLLDPWIVILGTLGLYFVGIWILFNGIAGIKDMVTTWAISLILLFLASYISIKSAIELLNG